MLFELLEVRRRHVEPSFPRWFRGVQERATTALFKHVAGVEETADGTLRKCVGRAAAAAISVFVPIGCIPSAVSIVATASVTLTVTIAATVTATVTVASAVATSYIECAS